VAVGNTVLAEEFASAPVFALVVEEEQSMAYTNLKLWDA